MQQQAYCTPEKNVLYKTMDFHNNIFEK